MLNRVDGLEFHHWSEFPQVRLCTTRGDADWGQSQGDFARLNLGLHVGDDPLLVKANRIALLQRLPSVSAIQWLQQTHSTDVVKACGGAVTLAGDASYTDQPGLACAVMTADCLPILLSDGVRVAAVHAGWRGLANGIVEQVLNQFPTRHTVCAYLAPAIGPQSFEVGPEVAQQFGADAKLCTVPGEGDRLLADIYALASLRLQAGGVARIRRSDVCTYRDERYFSYRRQNRTGRMASLIWLSGNT
ncbi:multi-copper polyphenol oxidoreductase [Bacterioplanes sanyensis]|uniref:Purine nucleoside phosphorylase n=2 Tax=Bacterioplanes sanyensis TaxID=1249553 RepID=A0A222FQ99_9GAMM|nr:multi-copper polyphenol oxidoreductase [Bacterioplanes sanyensis]